jgi:hypothetical protein
VAVHWPDGATNISPSRIGAVFEGDTVVASASFDRPQAGGTAVLEVETEKGEKFRQELGMPAAPSASSPDGLSTVARVAAAARLKEVDDEARLQTALRYRLVSPWTNWLVVAPRAEDEKARDIPALRKVPQTLAAGWGGTGRVDMSFSADAVAMPIVRESRRTVFAASADLDWAGVFVPSRRQPLDLTDAHRRLLALVNADASRLDMAGALDLLQQSGTAAEFDHLFQYAADLGISVDVVAGIVLARLLGGQLGELVSGAARLALASLQEHARRATDALRDMGRHGVALARSAHDPIALEILRRSSPEETLERFARIPDLLDHLQDAIRRSEASLQRPPSDRGAPVGGTTP